MQSFTPRAGRWPLALLLAAAAALGACADEPVGPRPAATPGSQASVQTLGLDEVTVTNTSGGTEVGSLRWAAGQVAKDGQIRFDPSLAGDTITLDAELYLDDVAVIEGPADKGITLSGNDQHRVILANQGVVLRNVTITKGNADYASAIYSGGLLSMYNSTVKDNRGIGAAVLVDWTTWISIANSTISGNVVGTSALRYRNGSTVQIYQSTITNNYPGTGLSMDSSNTPQSPVRVLLHNTIISSNGSPLLNCATTTGFQYQGMNISNDYSCGNTTGIVVLDPRLLPLADNGGPTMTHAIHYRSPALNAGESCMHEVDQRYVPRDAYCDIGAFEFTDFTAVTITVDPNANVSAATGTATVTGTVRCSRDGDEFGLRAQVTQQQKVGKKTTVVQGEGGTGVTCTTSPQPWSAVVAASSGAFAAGAAAVSVHTNDPPVWVTPASVSASVRFRRK